jgi:rhodanese-related sulfurtransferase
MSQRDQEISATRAARWLREERAVFVDARPSTAYEASGVRIPGALPVGAGSGVDILEACKDLPRDRPVVVYCDEPDQAASALIARRVEELGLGRAFFLGGGFAAWRQHGLPTEHVPDTAVAPEPQLGG